MGEHDWQDDAACRNDGDPDAWFAGPGESQRQAHAVEVCLGCPVRARCLEEALTLGLAGVWGATSERERRRMRHGLVDA